MRPRREKELRCFCASEPLLATYGVDRKGCLFIHIKVWKQRRIFGEIVVEGGVVKLRCRNCLRWHRVVIRGVKATLTESPDPEMESITT